MLARLADKIILKPTTHPISTEGKARRSIVYGEGRFEVWIQRTGPGIASEPDVYILKFPGTGGRAERMSEHPAEVWSDLASEIWTVNPPGYGGSSGRASLRFISAIVDAASRELATVASGKPVVVTGNSLGSLAALLAAASHQVDGLLLRNPVPLRQIILGRHSWWSLGLARLIADQVPTELCSIDNAARCSAPAVFVMSEQDRTVPPDYQRQIIDAYAGDHRIMRLCGAGHASVMDESQRSVYADLLGWLRKACIDG